MARSKATCRVSVEAELQQKKVNQIKPANKTSILLPFTNIKIRSFWHLADDSDAGS
jgi:hypothetical protein